MTEQDKARAVQVATILRDMRTPLAIEAATLIEAAYANTAQGEGVREAFKAGWRTNAVGEDTHSREYLDGCEQVDWEEYQRVGLSQYIAALAQPNPLPAQGEGQTAGSGVREAIKRLRFNADFQRGYGDDRFSIRRDDADLILAALSAPEDTPKPQPAEVEQVGDGALREAAQDAFLNLIADAIKFDEQQDEGAIYYTLEFTDASLVPLINALGIEQQFGTMWVDDEAFASLETPAEAIERTIEAAPPRSDREG